MLDGARLLLPELLPNVARTRMEQDRCSVELVSAD